MTAVLGIDIGSSITKIVVLNEKKEVAGAKHISASNQKTALFGAVGQALYEAGIALENVDQIVLTGVGAQVVEGDIFGRPTYRVTEFEALGRGGLFLSGLTEAVIGSVGTGTAFVKASNDEFEHVGGSAVGGGTLIGLCYRLFGIRNFKQIEALMENGDLSHVDLSINEVSSVQMATLPDFATASNLGKMNPSATDSDVALGILNMILQTAGTMAVLACRNAKLKEAVMVGSLVTMKPAAILLERVAELYGLRFVIPKQAAYATAIGAALSGMGREEED